MDDPSSSIGALISLLADESRSTQKAAVKALTEIGPAAEAALEWAAAGDEPRVRARARRVLAAMARDRGQRALRRILVDDGGYSSEEAPPEPGPLIEGLLAIDDILGFRRSGPSECTGGDAGAHAAGSGAASSEAERWIVERAEELGLAEAWREGPTLAVAGALRRILAEREGLRGPEQDFHNLQHVSLTRTITNREGLPLTLSAIYASVARRNGVEAWLLPFPGQVLLALGPLQDRVILDPFHGGALVSLETCRARLAAMGAPDSTVWLMPATDRDMLVRQVRNLGAAMLRHGRDREARLFARLVDDVT
ncbi:transglutaminase family protein [Saltatorellus ferox]